MGISLRHNVDEVQLLFGKKRLSRVVYAIGDDPSASEIEVASSYDLNARYPPPCFYVMTSEEAAANDRTPAYHDRIASRAASFGIVNLFGSLISQPAQAAIAPAIATASIAGAISAPIPVPLVNIPFPNARFTRLQHARHDADRSRPICGFGQA
jgi:hypothetical protein